MSFHSPMAPRTGSPDATVPPTEPLSARVSAETGQSLAWWGVLIDINLKAVRRVLTVRLASAESGERDCSRANFDAALAECDAIEASTAALIRPPHPAHDSFLGHLVAELEAAVALADREARIAALIAHKARLEEMLMCDGADGAGHCAR